jgi:transcriptional regulator with XRE-family HTH domain
MKTETFGERVKILRDRLDMSQVELAKKANIDRTSLSKMEKGIYEPKLQQLIDLARELNTNVQLLVTGDDLTPKAPDVAMTTEGNEVALLLDNMDEDLRQPVLRLARDLSIIGEQRRTL